MKQRESNLAKIQEWEYCYCTKCQKIRYSSELEATEKGVRCAKCGSYELEAPGWIHCPYEMGGGAVKCPRAGKGVVQGEYELECIYHCLYRKNIEN